MITMLSICIPSLYQPSYLNWRYTIILCLGEFSRNMSLNHIMPYGHMDQVESRHQASVTPNISSALHNLATKNTDIIHSKILRFESELEPI